MLDIVHEVTVAAESLKRALSNIFRFISIISLSSSGTVNTRCWYDTFGNWDMQEAIQRSVASLPHDEQILDLQE